MVNIVKDTRYDKSKDETEKWQNYFYVDDSSR